MPRAQDFTQSTIYHIRCIATRDVIYVGSSTAFGQRASQHKYMCNHAKQKDFHYPVYVHIRDSGGWDLFEVIPVAHMQLNNKTELRIAEQAEMDKYTTLHNVHYAARSKAEYRATHRDVANKYNEQYYADNKDGILAHQKQYYTKNKDAISEYGKQYRADNKDAIASRKALSVTCECGCVVTNCHLSRHMKTAKHFKLLEQLDQANYEPIALLPIAYDI